VLLLREGVDEAKGSAARISSRSVRVRSREVEVSSRLSGRWREVERSESKERFGRSSSVVEEEAVSVVLAVVCV